MYTPEDVHDAVRLILQNLDDYDYNLSHIVEKFDASWLRMWNYMCLPKAVRYKVPPLFSDSRMSDLLNVK